MVKWSGCSGSSIGTELGGGDPSNIITDYRGMEISSLILATIFLYLLNIIMAIKLINLLPCA